jgi:hypothetical protein
VLAGVILVVAVLPAEYGIDPLGAGRALGLTAMAESPGADAPPAPAAGASLAPLQQGAVALYPARFTADSRTFELGPYEYLEFKYHLEKGATMLFSWTAGGDVRSDFHGDAEGAPSTDQPTSYRDERTRSGNGSFAAPFTGIHGWFWENQGGAPVTVTLESAGFYTYAREFRMDKSQRTYELGKPGAAVPSTSPAQE